MTPLIGPRRLAPTRAQQRVLHALAAGEALHADPFGVVTIAGMIVNSNTLRVLLARGWVTEPLRPPLLGLPAEPGMITELGAMLWIGVHVDG